MILDLQSLRKRLECSEAHFDEAVQMLNLHKAVLASADRFGLNAYFCLLKAAALHERFNLQRQSDISCLLARESAHWSPTARATLLMCCKALLAQRKTDAGWGKVVLSWIDSEHECYYSSDPYVLVWLIHVLRAGIKTTGERAFDGREEILHKIVGRIKTTANAAYRLKLAAGMLHLLYTTDFDCCNRMWGDSLCTLVADVARDDACQTLLTDLVSERRRLAASQGDELGLVALSARPFARVFLMRLVIFVLSMLIRGADADDFGDFKDLVGWERWNCSIALMALFNDHEGLLYKMLTLLVAVETDTPASVFDSEYFNSVALYCDLLYRIQYDADHLAKSTEENHRIIVYLNRFFRSASQGLLHGLARIYTDPKIQAFHKDLLCALETRPHLRRLRDYLKIIIEMEKLKYSLS